MLLQIYTLMPIFSTICINMHHYRSKILNKEPLCHRQQGILKSTNCSKIPHLLQMCLRGFQTAHYFYNYMADYMTLISACFPPNYVTKLNSNDEVLISATCPVISHHLITYFMPSKITTSQSMRIRKSISRN